MEAQHLRALAQLIELQAKTMAELASSSKLDGEMSRVTELAIDMMAIGRELVVIAEQLGRTPTQ